MNRLEFIRTRRFVIQLGKTMHEYGTPSHRLEHILIETTHLLGLRGSFLVTPTSMSFIFWEQGSDDEYTHIARVNPNGLDLNRLARTHELVEDVLAGRATLDEGLERITQIRILDDPYPRWLEFLAWGGTSACFAVLCHAGLYDILASLLAGWLAFGLAQLTKRYTRFEEMLEPLVALLIAFVGSGIAAMGIPLDVPIVVLSGIIVFIPGLSLTMGLRELAARHLSSGTARIMDASMMLFRLYFGTAFGLALGDLVWGLVEYNNVAFLSHASAQYLAVMGLSISLLIIFKISHRDAVWGLLAGIIAYAGSLLGNSLFRHDLGGFAGAMILGLYANTYAQKRNTPTHIVLLPGIVLLVPGSKVYVGVSTMMTGETVLVDAASASQVFMSFMSIVAGLVFANVILPPKQRL